jgi:hypothetical protein
MQFSNLPCNSNISLQKKMVNYPRQLEINFPFFSSQKIHNFSITLFFSFKVFNIFFPDFISILDLGAHLHTPTGDIWPVFIPHNNSQLMAIFWEANKFRIYLNPTITLPLEDNCW